MRMALVTALVAALAWSAASAALWLGQEHLLFRPTALPADEALTREPDVHERVVEVPGARLSVLELRLPDPKGVVFFLHGNAGNLKEWFTNADFYRRANYDLVMMDYRGFGKSSSRIESEAQLHADVRAVWQAVAPRYAGRRVVIYGRSLGTGLAAALAAQVGPDLAVLVSPYTSMFDLAGFHYPWVPSAVLRYPLRTDQIVPALDTPLLLIHGDQDTLIPPAHSHSLKAIAPSARLLIIAGAGHGDVHRFESYRRELAQALDELR
jgi:pimeloyl-ACP methyl ester carboxylesterase